MEFLGKGNGYEARFGYRQSVIGDDAGIEARSSELEVRVSGIHIRDSIRASIRASTTTNVKFDLTIRASLPTGRQANPYRQTEPIL